MTRTTLHIGTTKTGSSSIQQFLATNRDALRSQNVLYPKALGKVSHNVIPVASKGRLAPTEHQRMFKITSERKYRTFIADRRKRLTREINRSQPDHILISSEHMHSRCFTPAHFEALKQFLAPALDGRDVQILVYLRPQIEHAISLYSTQLAHGLALDIDSFIEDRISGPKRRYHDFRKLIRSWQRAFPEATMTVRAFDAVKSLPEGVISDFMQVTGLQPERLEYPPRVNESLNAWSAEALRRVNAMTPPLPGSDIKKVRDWLRADRRAERLLPDPALSRRFQESFAAENDWVMARFLSDVPDALEPNWERLSAATQRPEISEGELRALVDQAVTE